MKKSNFLSLMLVGLVSFTLPGIAAECLAQGGGTAENITITTYYPAPYGVYKEIRADQMSIGSTYRTTATLSDGDLIVEGNVGIGTVIPSEKLEVNGKVRIGGYTLPNTDGNANDVLTTDGSGTISWTRKLNVLNGSYQGKNDPAPINMNIPAIFYPNAVAIFKGASQYDSDRNIKVFAKIINVSGMATWHIDIEGDIDGTSGNETRVYYSLLYW